MYQKGGFKLKKLISNSREALTTVAEERQHQKIKDQDINIGDLPVERALGVHWNIENDCLGFKINLKEKPLNRRGTLSTISSVYDPLGIAAPFVLEWQENLQKLCQLQVGWDDKIPDNLKKDWVCWRNKLPKLENIKVNRCYKPNNLGNVIKAKVHHFSDESEEGYGQCSYLRLINEFGTIHSSLLIGKSRVSPIKYVSIPRLELTAPTLSIKMSKLIKKELDIEDYEKTHWTDIKVILGYINNKVKRFKIFVSNRVQTIKENSNIKQWKHISSKDNPPDDGLRGLDATKVNKVTRWFNGSDFL